MQFAEHFFQRQAQRCIGTDAASDDQTLEAGLLEGALALDGQSLYHRMLEGQRDVATGLLTVVSSALALMPGVQGEGFKAAEAELQAWPVGHWPRKDETPCHAPARESRDLRAARIMQAHHLRSFVERLTGGIIQRLAQHLIKTDAIDPNQLRVAAGNQQSDERELWRLLFEHWRQEMPFHVMHAQGWNAPGKGQRLSAGSAHQQRPDQTRTRGVRNGVDFGGDTVRFSQHLADQRQHTLDVVTRSQLRYNPAVRAMQVDLAEQCVGQQAAFTVIKCDTGFVAGGF